VARTPGLSVRLKLTLSYVGFLMLTVALLAVAAWVFFLRYIPTQEHIVPGSTGSDTKTLIGGTVGAGFAYSVSRNWDIGAEYRYTRYEGADFGLGQVAAIAAGPGGPFAFVSATTHVDLQTHQVLLKANYRFD